MFEILSVCRGGGYHYVRTQPPHPRRNSNGLYPRHIVVMENKLGRLLVPGETVHHKDHDKSNDNPDNLEIKTNAQHSRDHALERAPAPVECACLCGKSFQLSSREHRWRTRRSKSGVIYCSRSCGSRFPQVASPKRKAQPRI